MAVVTRPEIGDDGFVWEEPTEERPFTGQAHVLDANGDSRIMWNKDNPEEVAGAKDMFKRLTRGDRYRAFVAQGDKGEPGRRLEEFDPSVERMVFVPALQGG